MNEPELPAVFRMNGAEYLQLLAGLSPWQRFQLAQHEFEHVCRHGAPSVTEPEEHRALVELGAQRLYSAGREYYRGACEAAKIDACDSAFDANLGTDHASWTCQILEDVYETKLRALELTLEDIIDG